MNPRRRPEWSRVGADARRRLKDASRWRRSAISSLRLPLAALLLGLVLSCPAASLPAEWQRQQTFTIRTAPSFVILSLPVETLDAARPALEDLRLYDEAANEVPYGIERPRPADKLMQPARDFRVSLHPGRTVATFETGLAQAIAAVTVTTPATSFLKSVQVQGSSDGRRWELLAEGQPIFRQANGASQLRIELPAGTWRFIRLTLDDERSAPIPITGASVHTATAEPTPTETSSLRIVERHENSGETRLTLDLGAANLDLATLELETDELLFTRTVTLAVPVVAEDGVREQVIGQGTIYRVAVEGLTSGAVLAVELERQVQTRELRMLIQNGDSPPLAITAVRATRRPVHLVFLARNAGTYHLLTGNPHCAAPRYDVAALRANFASLGTLTAKVSPLVDNPAYRPPEVLAGIAASGSTLDVGPWRYRKAIKLLHPGAQQLELDLEVLAHAQRGFGDLRLMRAGQQVPYVLERTSFARTISPGVTVTNDAESARRSVWRLQLPQAGLPLTHLSATSAVALFERNVELFEEVADDRGTRQLRRLGGALWVQTPDRKGKELALTPETEPQSDTLFLASDNGDNPPIQLGNIRVQHRATRILFKAQPDDDLLLYYGNAKAAAPKYDLGLVAGELLAAPKSIASLVAEERVGKVRWGEGRAPGKGGVVFWGILAAVVIGLLAVIARLLPKAAPPTN